MHEFIVSPSILAADFLNLESEINNFENEKNLWLHLDVMDGHFVPNLTFGKPLIKRLSEKTKLPLDAHLMVSNPEFHLEELKNIPLENFTFHLEATDMPLSLIEKAKTHFSSVGISIKPNTKVEQLTSEMLENLDLILVMSVEPGFGGQSFQPECLEKIKKLKNLRQQNNYKFQIQVDGGITDQTAPLVKEAGADNLVAGSFIFKNNPQDYLNFVKKLR